MSDTKYTNEELSQEIYDTTNRLGWLLEQAYERESQRRVQEITSSLRELNSTASMMLGFAPAARFETVDEWPILLPDTDTEPDAKGDVELFPEIQPEPESFTSSDAAEILGISKPTVMAMVKRGQLKTKGKVRHGKVTIITRASLKREVESRGLAWPW